MQSFGGKNCFFVRRVETWHRSKSGVRKGSLAYITGGSESWTLLEVSNVTQTSAILKPINAMSNPKTLGNQTIRFIEGAM